MMLRLAAIDRWVPTPGIGGVEYLDGEFSIRYNGLLGGGGVCGTILVNDINIGYNADGMLVDVWGMCPKPRWVLGEVKWPKCVRWRLKLIQKDEQSGVSIRINDAANARERWPTEWDPIKKVLCIGKRIGDCECVEFLPGCALLLQSWNIAGLILRVNGE